MELLSSLAGGLLVLLLFSFGFFAGWKLHTLLASRPPRRAKPTEMEARQLAEQQRQLIERQNAFRILQDYSTERAYGMVNAMEEPPSSKIGGTD